jgi:lipid II:glycine glycyltransferase (peptidoglycan interpeptide bridge formation enzyme)
VEDDVFIYYFCQCLVRMFLIFLWLIVSAPIFCLTQAGAEQAAAAAQEAAAALRAKLDASEEANSEARAAAKAAEERLAGLEGAVERETATLKVIFSALTLFMFHSKMFYQLLSSARPNYKF